VLTEPHAGLLSYMFKLMESWRAR